MIVTEDVAVVAYASPSSSLADIKEHVHQAQFQDHKSVGGGR